MAMTRDTMARLWRKAWTRAAPYGRPKDRLESALLTALVSPATASGTGSQERRVLVIPSQRPGGLGDEAMVTAAFQQLRLGGARVGIAEYDDANSWAKRLPFDFSVSLARFFHLDQRVSAASYVDLGRFVHEARHLSHLITLGADVVDGFYSEPRSVKRLLLTSIAANCGVDSRLINFSLNECPRRRSVDALRRLPPTVRLYTRDLDSQRRLVEHVGRQATLHSDIAFSLTPEHTPLVVNTQHWARTQRNEKRTVLGINVNPLTFSGFGSNPVARIIDVTAHSLSSLHSRRSDLSLLFIPHDWRQPITEEALAHEIVDRLPPRLRNYCTIVPGPFSAMEAKALTAECDLIVTGRMHLAIAALGNGVPAMSLPYQGKFEGLMKHFDTPELVLDMDFLVGQGSYAVQVEATLRSLDDVRDKVHKALPAVLDRSTAPFEFLYR